AVADRTEDTARSAGGEHEGELDGRTQGGWLFVRSHEQAAERAHVFTRDRAKEVAVRSSVERNRDPLGPRHATFDHALHVADGGRDLREALVVAVAAGTTSAREQRPEHFTEQRQLLAREQLALLREVLGP